MKNLILILLVCSSILLMSSTDGEKHCYIRLTESFKNEYSNYQSGVNVLIFVQDTEGYWCVSSNALNEFPEVFDTMQNIQLIWLAPEAFSVDTTNYE